MSAYSLLFSSVALGMASKASGFSLLTSTCARGRRYSNLTSRDLRVAFWISKLGPVWWIKRGARVEIVRWRTSIRQSTVVGVFQCLPLVGWCVAHAVIPSCRLRRNLSVNQSINLCKVTLKINCLKAFTRVRQILKHLNQLRRKGKVVN